LNSTQNLLALPGINPDWAGVCRKTIPGRKAKRLLSLDGETPRRVFYLPREISRAATFSETMNTKPHRIFPNPYKPVPEKKVARRRQEK
jgi:hypothetical protein